MIDQTEAIKTWPILKDEPDFTITLLNSDQIKDMSEFVKALVGVEGLIATKTGIAIAWLEGDIQCALRINYGKMAIELISSQSGFFKFKANEGFTRKVTIENKVKKSSIYFCYTREGKPDMSTNNPPSF